MKLILSLFIAAAIIITASGQAKEKNRETTGMPNTQIIDTPRSKYFRFYTIRIDTTEYQRSIDTLVIGKGYIGRNLFHDDALFWQDAMIRALQRIDNRVQRDSVKIQGGNK